MEYLWSTYAVPKDEYTGPGKSFVGLPGPICSPLESAASRGGDVRHHSHAHAGPGAISCISQLPSASHRARRTLSPAATDPGAVTNVSSNYS